MYVKLTSFKRYYVLFGVCVVFCVILSFSFMGSFGIFFKSEGSKTESKLTRNTFAGCLSCSTIFYFLLIWLICLISVPLIAPSVLFRQVICKPIIELEDNSNFRVNLDFLLTFKLCLHRLYLYKS